jgi:hypothetical protein
MTDRTKVWPDTSSRLAGDVRTARGPFIMC